MKPGKPSRPVDERFHEKVHKSPDGCWVWQGHLDQHGYGRLQTGSRGAGDRKSALAHRLAYVLLVGPIPAGLDLDHICRNRRCVNPKHLRAVTRQENTRLGESPPAQNARKTQCRKGHPFDQENTYHHNGHRYCRICNAAAQRAHKATAKQAL